MIRRSFIKLLTTLPFASKIAFSNEGKRALIRRDFIGPGYIEAIDIINTTKDIGYLTLSLGGNGAYSICIPANQKIGTRSNFAPIIVPEGKILSINTSKGLTFSFDPQIELAKSILSV